MEQEIQDRFNDEILVETRKRYGIAASDLQELDAFESYIYAFQKNGRDYILRIGHSRRRSAALIHGEVDWINYLAAGGAGVAKAILSETGELVELIDDDKDGQFLATAFVKAEGGNAHQMGLWDDQLFVRYGRLLGRIHKLSKQYQPSQPTWKRPSWDDPIMQYAALYLNEKETAVRERYQALMDHLQSLPVDKAGYGLIHQDAHAGNFFVDEQYNITLFDFDDCVYSHYVNDIAMVMFYAITNHPTPTEQLMTLWPLFMQGYAEENELDSSWFKEILPFMKLREIDLFGVLLDTFGYGQTGNAWIDTFMNGRREKIINEDYVNFNFSLT